MAKLINLKLIEDNRGALVVAQDEIPFSIKRVFFIQNVSAERGGHRHKKNQMALIAQQGTVEVYSQSQTIEKTFVLDDPRKCLLLEPEDWHTMKFSEKAILLVLCSEKFDPDDYITNKHSD